MNPERPRPSPEQVSKVYRNLADRHAEERSRLSASRSWARLQAKVDSRQGGGQLLRLLAQPSRLRTLLFSPAAGLFVAAGVLASTALLLGSGGFLGSGGQPWSWNPWSSGQAQLSYELRTPSAGGGGAERLLEPDGWIRTGNEHAELSFSDQSRVELSARSVLRLEVTGEHSAKAELATGQLSADILHADTTKWLLQAGPYVVEVVGTRFDLNYDEGGFSLAMHAGRVRISGPGEQHWILDAGQTLHLPAALAAGEQARAALRDGDEHSERASLGPSTLDQLDEREPEAVIRAARRQAAAASPSAPNATTTGTGNQRLWPQLVAKGQFERVVQEAKALGAGLPSVLTQAEVAAVAQAAGYSGDSRLAERCWRHLRQHFARTSGASKAAFYLARLAEQRGDLPEALNWLGTYGREAPGGAFAAEALGRQLLILRRTEGRSSRANETARDYLRRFPEGAYREAALATLEASRAGR